MGEEETDRIGDGIAQYDAIIDHGMVMYLDKKGTQSSAYLRQAERFTFCIPPIGRIWIRT